MRQAILLAGICAALAAPAHAQDHTQDHTHEQAAAGAMPAQAQGRNGPLWSQADRYYGAGAMAEARAQVRHHAGGQTYWQIMAERLELQSRDGDEATIWDAQAYYGGDIHKLYLKTEGEYAFADDAVEEAEIQALWSRAISPYFDVQGGLRYDIEPDGTAHGVIGVQGLAPYLFETDLAAFLSENGDLTVRAEVEYELLLTQRLILQPRLEAHFSAQDIPQRGTGSGVTHIDAGLRLRYEIRREFAPYLGVEWQSALGETADLIENGGGDPDGAAVLIGLRAWF